MKKRISGLAFGVAILAAVAMSFNPQTAQAAAGNSSADLIAEGKCGKLGQIGPITTCRGACTDCYINTSKR